MDLKLLSLLSYFFYSQLLFPSKTCQFVPSDPDVIIAWLSNKRWFSASNWEASCVETEGDCYLQLLLQGLGPI